MPQANKSTPSEIVVTRAGRVGRIWIDRRRRFNALDIVTARDLRRAALGLARDPSIRVVVLAGEGGVFCSGADLKYVKQGGTPQDLEYLRPAADGPETGHGAVFREILEYLHATIAEIRRAPKPFIAAVDGMAAAGGLGLALCCDLVVASERSSFEYAYFKTGLSGAESNTALLPKLLGLRRALDFVFLEQRVDAHEAHKLGLVSQVFRDQDFDNEVTALAVRLAEGPTSSYAAVKRLMNASAGLGGLSHHLSNELEALVESADSTDFGTGLDAFLNKTKPVFKGD